MKKLEVKGKRMLSKDIKILKKAEPFTKMSDKEFLNYVYVTALVVLTGFIGLLFKMEYLAFLNPLWIAIFPNLYLTKEFIKLKKRKKAEKNITKVINELDNVDVKTNAKDLVDSTIRHREMDYSNSYTNCYLFLDDNKKVNGLYEEINKDTSEINYYVLNDYELNKCYNFNAKKKVLVKDTVKWR